MSKKIPLVLLIIIIIIGIFGSSIPLEIKSIFYALSLTIKTVIIFVLPFIIFSLLFRVGVNFAQRGSRLIFLILGCVCVSNLFSTLLSYFIGSWVYGFELSLALPDGLKELEPYWKFSLPKFIANDKAMFSGLIIGIITSFFQPQFASKLTEKLEKIISHLLSFIVLLIPLFVTGFVVKLQFEGLMTRIIEDYGVILAVICLTQLAYLNFLYFAFANFNVKNAFQNIRNMIPAAITGFSAMSSVAAMPLTIMGAEKNVKNPDLARSVIPATVNIHLIGDSIAIPIFAFAVLKNYSMVEPSFYAYFVFALYFIVAKFSVAAIPGGSILVMLPILEAHLEFNAEMLSLITALYVLFDSFVTTANVLGHGIFAIAIEKLYNFLEKKPVLVED